MLRGEGEKSLVFSGSPSPRSAVGAKLERGLGGEVRKGTELRHRTHSILTPMGPGGEVRKGTELLLTAQHAVNSFGTYCA